MKFAISFTGGMLDILRTVFLQVRIKNVRKTTKIHAIVFCKRLTLEFETTKISGVK